MRHGDIKSVFSDCKPQESGASEKTNSYIDISCLRINYVLGIIEGRRLF